MSINVQTPDTEMWYEDGLKKMKEEGNTLKCDKYVRGLRQTGSIWIC